MELLTLGQALEIEHRQIDGGIEAYVASLDGASGATAGTGAGAAPGEGVAAAEGVAPGERVAADAEAGANPGPLLAALTGLRRYIYLEEEFLFPPLKAAGLMGPIFVMLREHGILWKQMDALEALLQAAAAPAELRNACNGLLSLLSDHNSKEEPIIYTQADGILDAAAGADLLEFLDKGTTPEGWVASAA